MYYSLIFESYWFWLKAHLFGNEKKGCKQTAKGNTGEEKTKGSCLGNVQVAY